MKHRTQRLKELMKQIRAGSVIYVAAVLLITAGLAVYIGLRIHGMQKESLILQGEVNTQEATLEYNRYLLTRVDIVTMVSGKVEGLLASGADSTAIERYLTDDTDIIVATLDPETTGLYGVFNGTYVDGAGWVPDEDYVPEERPWYIQSMETGGRITFVDPYLDAQTNTVMMTVAKLLSDGQSVLAMDVSLRPIQEMVEKVAASTAGGQAFLMDENGAVIVHSDRSQLEKNYLAETDSLGGIIARRLLKDGETQFEVSTPQGNYTVYTHELEGGWYSISMIDSDVWHGPIHRTMIIFAVILGLVFLSILAVFLRLTAKNAALEELHHRVDQEEKRGDELQALSETDRMTGLMDRVSAEQRINGLLQTGGGMFLEMDIDRFKEINDTCGHQTGDAVILAVANAIRGTFRTNDVVIRMGGDEFGVFAVGIGSKEMGVAMVERFFRRIGNIEIPELGGHRICISAGAVLTPDGKNTSFRELYAAADAALYHSKKDPESCLTFA